MLLRWIVNRNWTGSTGRALAVASTVWIAISSLIVLFSNRGKQHLPKVKVNLRCTLRQMRLWINWRCPFPRKSRWLSECVLKLWSKHAFVNIPTRRFSQLLQNLMVKYLQFFPLPDYYLMMIECSYSWCSLSMFDIFLCCLCLSSNACSVLRYDQPFLCGCAIRVPLWYGPWAWRKIDIIYSCADSPMHLRVVYFALRIYKQLSASLCRSEYQQKVYFF